MKNKKFITFGLMFLSAFTLTVVVTSTSNIYNVQAVSKHTTKKTKKAMNVKQIANGNYSSIKGDWKEVGHIENHSVATNGNQIQSGGDETLSISKHKIASNEIKLYGNTLEADNQKHELDFKKNKGTLVASLKDQDVAINWSVSFYPKGKTTRYSSDGKPNNTDFIVVWSSNNNHTEIFVPKGNSKKNKSVKQKSDKRTPISAAKKQTSTLNLAQINNDNFSSLQGTWKNPSSGQKLVISDKVATAPENSNVVTRKGAIITNSDDSEGTKVIAGGKLLDGYLQGTIGTYSDQEMASAFAPALIIPKGVKANTNDDSNSNKDRIIEGGGQGGYAQEAYYRE